MEVVRNTARTLGLCSIVVVSISFAAEKGTFQPPSLKGYIFQQVWDSDWDENGVNESYTKLYRNSAGDEIIKLYKKGTAKVWGWALDTHGDKDSNVSKNYLLRDSNGDGQFNQRYNLSEDVLPPVWVK